MDTEQSISKYIKVLEKTPPERWWKIFVIAILVLLFIFILLNGVNILPNRDYSRLNGPITEHNAITGQAIQLYPEGGITTKVILTATHKDVITPTIGLCLSSIPARSLMVNSHASNSGIPSSLFLPLNSVLISSSNGLEPLTVQNPNQVLTFDGESIVWGPIVDHLPNIPAGHLFVGNSEGEAVSTAVTGDFTLSPSGMATITNNAITTNKILDGNVTVSKIIQGDVGQVLTSASSSTSIWKYPQNDLATNKNFATSGSNQNNVVVFPTHTYNLTDVMTLNGQVSEFEAFGQSIADANPVQIGIQLVGSNVTSNYMVSVPSNNFQWKLSASVIRLPPNGTNVGIVNIVLYEGTNSHCHSSEIENLNWNSNVSVNIICQTTSETTVESAITCRFSSADFMRPAVIR
jgi:hypothetical protein